MLSNMTFQQISMMTDMFTDQAIKIRKEAQAEIVHKLLRDPSLSESTRAELKHYFGGTNA